ncbi:sodium- and chloride-dependent GABA transporter 2-like [Argopecten irradians]|uniref:sodium- and chloride-dependent GABA transporter 2-like n=1 Tax=Argopecten irradians TaxID=31199 RepID=UPI00371F2A75
MELQARTSSSGSIGSDEVKNEVSKPEQWGNKVDFFLSVLGLVVGFGNVWRFPYVCMKNGGGAFLLPYLITIFLLAIPVYFMEAALGQYSGRSMRDVWIFCPLIQGLGLGLLFLMILCVWYYVMLTTWVIYYLYQSFTSPLPWSTCGNQWNTPDCFSFLDMGSSGSSSVNSTGINGTVYNVTSNYSVTNVSSSNKTGITFLKGHSSEEEFWQYKVLDITAGFNDFGSLKGHLALCLLVTWIIVYLCVIKGIRSSGKVVYVTATLPYILLTIILVRSLTLPGSVDGIIFFLKPDFPSLLNSQVWIQAAIQVFYSMGIGWGIHITLSSFNKFNNNCYRDAFLLTLAGEGTSVFAGLVVFSALGFMAHTANMPVEDIVKSGPGLGFIAYPQALAQMPYSNLWAVLFFLALLTVGLDSQFAFTETVCEYLESSFPRLGRRRVLFRAALAVLGFLASLIFCTRGGVYLFQLIDWYCAAFSPILFTLMTCVTVSWVYGAERFCRDIEMMLGRTVPLYIRFCWCFISPILALGLMVTSLVTYVPPTYGDYTYPWYAATVGWVFACSSVIPVVVVGISVLWNAPGDTLYQRLLWSLKPTDDWKPSCKREVDHSDDSLLGERSQQTKDGDVGGSLSQRIMINIGLRKEEV